MKPIIVHNHVGMVIKSEFLDIRINRLNKLIENYNSAPSPLLLQRIDVAAKILFKQYQDDPGIVTRGDLKENRKQRAMKNYFIQWYLQNPIDKEVKTLLQAVSPEEAKKKDRAKQPSILNLLTWEASTTPKTTGLFQTTRTIQYQEMDNAIQKVELAKNILSDDEDNPAASQKLYAALSALQMKTIYFLNYQIPDNKPHMKKTFEELLKQTNLALKDLLQERPKLGESQVLTALTEKGLSQLTQYSKESFFLATLEAGVSSLEDWKNSTVNTEHQKYYREMDDYLAQVDRCRDAILRTRQQEQEQSDVIVDFDEEDLNNALIDLQTKITEMLDSELIQNDETLKQKFEHLLDSTNRSLNELVVQDAWTKKCYQAGTPISIADEMVAENLVIRLDPKISGTTQFDLAQLNFRFLGGNNNKNWLVTDEEGYYHSPSIIRLEEADLLDYGLYTKVQANEKLRQHFATNNYYFPCERPEDVLMPNKRYNLVWSEYCPNQDLLSYSSKTTSNKLDQALELTKKVAVIAQDLTEEKLGYTDIKAANFLLRNDGTVITADTKSFVSLDDNGKFSLKGSLTTRAYRPEDEDPAHAESFMTYQIGLMLYELIVASPTLTEKPWLDRGKSLDFNLPLFNTPQGKKIQALVAEAMDLEPKRRPSLKEVIQRCNDLQLKPILYQEPHKQAEKTEKQEVEHKRVLGY
jgi:hypothetical protein